MTLLRTICLRLHERGVERTQDQVVEWVKKRLKSKKWGRPARIRVAEAIALLNKDDECFERMVEEIKLPE